MNLLPCIPTGAIPVAIAILGSAFAVEPAFAQAPTCQIASFAGPLFGQVNVLTGAEVHALGSVTVSCTGGGAHTGAAVCVQIGPGTQAGVAPGRILVGSGGSTLRMNFFDGASIWGRNLPSGFGSGAVQLDVPLTNGAGTSSSRTIKGTIAAGQTEARPGEYTNNFDLSYYYQFYTGNRPDCLTMSGYTGPVTDQTFITTATVMKRCDVTASNLDFGAIGLLNRNYQAQSTLSVKCSNGISYDVSLSSGNNGTNPSQRKMKNPATGETIAYQLYQDTGRILVWGDAGQSKQGAGSADTQQLTVYGQIPIQSPTPTPGSYTDTVVVTVTY